MPHAILTIIPASQQVNAMIEEVEGRSRKPDERIADERRKSNEMSQMTAAKSDTQLNTASSHHKATFSALPGLLLKSEWEEERAHAARYEPSSTGR